MKRRIANVMLCVIVTAGIVITGCGKGDSSIWKFGSGNGNGKDGEKGSSKYREFLTIDVFDSVANYQGIQSGWFAKIIKDKFNMELNIIAPNVAGGDTLFQTRTAAGNLGDLIITGTEAGRFKNIVKAGLLMDLTDLLDGKAVLDQHEAAIRKANADAGQDGIYGIPSEISIQSPQVPTDGIDPLVAPYVRWDAYRAAGYPNMETLEDWIAVMKQLQELIPQSDSGKKTYAISLFKDWDSSMMTCAKNYASLYGYNELGFVLCKADGSDLQDILDENGQYLRVLRFLFAANQEGLIDPESETQNYDTLSDKYRDGQILTSLWSWQGKDLYNHETDPAQGRTHKELGKGFYPALIRDLKCYSNGCYFEGNARLVIAIGSQAKDPQRLADFIDWLYSPEGMEIAGQASGTGGPQGLAWELENGRPVYTEFGMRALPGNDIPVPEEWAGKTTGSWKDGAPALNFKSLSPVDIDPNTNEPYLTVMWSSVLEKNHSQLDLDWQEYAGGAKTGIEFLESNDALLVAPGTSYTAPEESSDITILRNKCKSVIIDHSWKMVFAENEAAFNRQLKDMQETLNGLGYAQVLAVDMQNAKEEADSRKQAVEDFKKKAETSS